MYTDYRPTPLQHFMFPSGGDGLYLIVDERSTFREDNFQKAIAALTSSAAEGGARSISHACRSIKNPLNILLVNTCLALGRTRMY